MDIRACRNCGKPFQSRGAYMCPDCIHKIDEKFTNVRNYMYQNPTATIDEICEENDVTADMVMRWLREGRLMVAQDSGLLKCEVCAKPIQSGKMCQACAGNFVNRVDMASKDIAVSIQKEKEAAERRGYHTRLKQ